VKSKKNRKTRGPRHVVYECVIGYAIWAGIGSVGATLFGSILLGKTLTIVQGTLLAVIISGVIWLKLAASAKPQQQN